MAQMRERISRLPLSSDRAENSIMAVISNNVAAILMIPVLTVFGAFVIHSVSSVSESHSQAALSVAGQQFQSDIQRATTIIPVSDTTIAALSDKYFQDSGERMTQEQIDSWVAGGSDPSLRACRVSVWNISDSSELQNIVTWEPASSCDPTTGWSVSSIETLITSPPGPDTTVGTPVSGLLSDTKLRYFNIATYEMTYSLGVWNNKPPVGTRDPAMWFTPAEWSSEDIKRVDLEVQADFSITGQNNAVFSAVTSAILHELIGAEVTVPGTNPDLHVPNPVENVLVERCDTAPPEYDPTAGAGYFECIDVTWDPRPADECSAIQTITYNVIVRNKSTGAQTDLFQVSLTDTEAKILGVWNGNTYDVIVTAQCFDGGPDSESNPKVVIYDQGLPAPRVNIAFGSTESQHVVSWSRTSSDPRTQYALEYQPYSASNSYTQITEPGASPRWHWLSTPLGSGSWTNQTLTIPDVETVTLNGKSIQQGVPDSYRVRASIPLPPGDNVNNRLRSAWGYGSIVYSIVISTPPGVDVGDPDEDDPEVPVTVIGDPDAICPAHTTPRLAHESHRGKNAVSVANWVDLWHSPTWGLTTIRNQPLEQGSLVVSRVLISCYNQFVPLPNINYLALDAYNRNLTNFTIAQDLDSNAVNRANESTQQHNSSGRQNNSRFSTWDWAVRPITVPAIPTNLRVTSNTSGLGMNSTVAWNGVVCATGTTANYLHQYFNVNGSAAPIATYPAVETAGTTITKGHPEPSGSRYDWRVSALCENGLPTHDLPSGLTALQQSAWSPAAPTYFVGDVRTPSVSATVNRSSVNAGSSYIASYTVTCSTGNAASYTHSSSTTYTPGSTGYAPSTYYHGGYTRSGYCNGYWTGTGARVSSTVSTTTPSVLVYNPAPPLPASPSGCAASSLVSTSDRRGVSTMTSGCNAASYATSYSGHATSSWADGYSRSHTPVSNPRSTPSFTYACFGRAPAGWTSIQFTVTSINMTGSRFTTWSVFTPTSYTGPVSCN